MPYELEKPVTFPRKLKQLIRTLFKGSKLPAENIAQAINSIYTSSFRKLGFLIERIGNVTSLPVRESRRLIHEVLCYCREHPVKVTFILIVAMMTICTPIVAAVILKALGFGATGPIGGSSAASFQSAFGVNTIFSSLQSAAMGGYALPMVTTIVAGAGALACATVAVGSAKIAGYAVTAVTQTVKVAQVAVRALAELGSKIWALFQGFAF